MIEVTVGVVKVSWFWVKKVVWFGVKAVLMVLAFWVYPLLFLPPIRNICKSVMLMA